MNTVLSPQRIQERLPFGCLAAAFRSILRYVVKPLNL
jgi:hypothetical protein